MDNTYFLWAGGIFVIMTLAAFLGRFAIKRFDNTKLGKKLDKMDIMKTMPFFIVIMFIIMVALGCLVIFLETRGVFK